jgi:hypothetical protein
MDRLSRCTSRQLPGFAAAAALAIAVIGGCAVPMREGDTATGKELQGSRRR